MDKTPQFYYDSYPVSCNSSKFKHFPEHSGTENLKPPPRKINHQTNKQTNSKNDNTSRAESSLI